MLNVASVPGQPSPEVPGDLNQTANNERINENKALRQNLAAFVDHLRDSPIRSAERTLAFRALQQARHWLGEDLAIAGAKYPYPQGNDAKTLVVDAAADTQKP